MDRQTDLKYQVIHENQEKKFKFCPVNTHVDVIKSNKTITERKHRIQNIVHKAKLHYTIGAYNCD